MMSSSVSAMSVLPPSSVNSNSVAAIAPKTETNNLPSNLDFQLPLITQYKSLLLLNQERNSKVRVICTW